MHARLPHEETHNAPPPCALPNCVLAQQEEAARIRTEVINREIKTNLTQILLEVTDKLFGERTPPHADTQYTCTHAHTHTHAHKHAFRRLSKRP